jgi:hypothetical protein
MAEFGCSTMAPVFSEKREPELLSRRPATSASSAKLLIKKLRESRI